MTFFLLKQQEQHQTTLLKAVFFIVLEYSNWYGANVDPQDLRRHKDLLDRQHYSGPFWEGRPKNPSILEEENPRYEKVDPEEHPDESLREEKESSFEKVKR